MIDSEISIDFLNVTQYICLLAKHYKTILIFHYSLWIGDLMSKTPKMN